MEISLCPLCVSRFQHATTALTTEDANRAREFFRQIVICHADAEIAGAIGAQLTAAERYLDAVAFWAEAIRRDRDNETFHGGLLLAAFRARCAIGYDQTELADSVFAAWVDAYEGADKRAALLRFAKGHANAFTRRHLPALLPDNAWWSDELMACFDQVIVDEPPLSHADPASYEQIFGNRLYSMVFSGFVNAELPSDTRNAVEFGAGTGLLRQFLRPDLAVTAIDLSPGMLELAKNKGYRDIIVGDVLSRHRWGCYDAVLSVGTIMLFESLSEVFLTAHNNLAEGGAFLFGCEACSNSQPVRRLSPEKFAHSAGYIAECAAETGFELVRMEIASQVGLGYHVHLRKK